MVRWAAAEVLQHSRYSAASDVWAFGMLAYEVFSRDYPYSHIDDEADVWNAILDGQRPSCPAGCPQQVYTTLMQACWHADPNQRPTISELHAAVVRFGGDLSVGSADSHQRSTEWDRLRKVHDPAYFQTPEGRKLLGISVYHLSSTFYPVSLCLAYRCFAALFRGASHVVFTASSKRGIPTV